MYRPGSSNGNRLSTYFFLNEFGSLLEQYTADPGVSGKEIEYRKIKSIDIERFRNDTAVSSLVQSPSGDPTELVSRYDSKSNYYSN